VSHWPDCLLLSNTEQNTIESYSQALEDLVKIEVQYLEATSDLQTLRLRNVDGTRLLEAKRAQLQDTHARLREARSKATQLQKTAEQASRLVSQEPDGDALVEQLREHDIDRLEADIGSEQARLELTHGGSSHLIKEFEDREKTIEHMRSKLADFEAKVAELSTAIGELRKQWEPRLEALIEKISDAFSDSFQRIGCAGQVTLGKAEDVGPNEFAEWSIVIHVAFRQNIPLSILNAHRQSGGERAVSTIFYLMALQSLSASPFRVVDEINQGMDPRNERMVHGRLVDIACASSEPDEFDDNGNPIGGGGGGQYFLITPKLLNGLVYKRGMRVLCIYSGEHMPEDSGKIDFKKAIRNHAADVASRKRNGQPRALQGNGQVNVYA
jgi:chromosome segregation ATPase